MLYLYNYSRWKFIIRNLHFSNFRTHTEPHTDQNHTLTPRIKNNTHMTLSEINDMQTYSQHLQQKEKDSPIVSFGSVGSPLSCLAPLWHTRSTSHTCCSAEQVSNTMQIHMWAAHAPAAFTQWHMNTCSLPDLAFCKYISILSLTLPSFASLSLLL